MKKNKLKGAKLYNGQYTLGHQIADGGFAVIYSAYEVGRKEPLAIKICNKFEDDYYSRSLIQEATLIQRLNHRNIVRLHLITREGKASVYYANAIELNPPPTFFLMEYLSGGTLNNYLDNVGQLTPPESATIALEIARALDHIHEKGIAHNDLKLENVVFRNHVNAGQPFEPVLIDFGIATRVNPPPAITFYVSAPEQLPGGQVPDPAKVDVWGLGVILYRMLGGRLPFSGNNEKSLTSRIKEVRPVSLRQLSTQVTSGLDGLIIDGCLAKNPSDRLTLLQLGQELKKYGDGVPAQQGGPSPQLKRNRWRFWERMS